MSEAAKEISVCARAPRVTSKRRMERNKNRRIWVTVTRWEVLSCKQGLLGYVSERGRISRVGCLLAKKWIASSR